MSSYQIPTIYTDELGLYDETGTSHGLNCNDMYQYVQATDNNYIPYSYPSSVKKTQKTPDKKKYFRTTKTTKTIKTCY